MASLPKHLQPLPVGREPLPREVMEAHQRDRVLDSAIEVFAKRGYRATTVDHLVAAARIGVGSFYDLFDGKESCFLAAYDRIVAQARAEILAAIPPDAPCSDQALAALPAVLAFVAERRLQARIVLVEAPTAGARALARYEQTLGELVPVLRRCRQDSPFAEQLSPVLEEAILGGAAWLIHQQLVSAEAREVERLLPELVEVVLAPYLGQEEADRLALARPAPA